MLPLDIFNATAGMTNDKVLLPVCHALEGTESVAGSSARFLHPCSAKTQICTHQRACWADRHSLCSHF